VPSGGHRLWFAGQFGRKLGRWRQLGGRFGRRGKRIRERQHVRSASLLFVP
jgi:hypothetical protein